VALIASLVLEEALLDDSDRFHAVIVNRFLVVRADPNRDVVDAIFKAVQINHPEYGVVDLAFRAKDSLFEALPSKPPLPASCRVAIGAELTLGRREEIFAPRLVANSWFALIRQAASLSRSHSR
jgi:hypothetical protein